jgi:hypothetical protein
MKTICDPITSSSLIQLLSRFREKICRAALAVYRVIDDSFPYHCLWLGITGQTCAPVKGVAKDTSENPIFRLDALRLACLPHFVTVWSCLKKLSLTYQPYAALKILLGPCLVWKPKFWEAPLTTYSQEYIL